MKVLVQRVYDCNLKVDGELISEIEKGLLVYLGVKVGDSETELNYLVNKVGNLRVFEDENGKMNLSVKDIGGEIMLVSQFTLYGDSTRGFRPSYTLAEEPTKANTLYEKFKTELEKQGLTVKTGVFGADMKLAYVNDGPVSIIIEKERVEKKI